MKKLLFIMTVLLLCYALNYDILAQQIVATTTYPTTMTEPGQSAVINTRNKAYTHVCWYFTIANINSSVSVSLQTKAGLSAWTPVWVDSLTYTKNGNYALEWSNVGSADSVKFVWSSESGGTAATIVENVKLIGGI